MVDTKPTDTAEELSAMNKLTLVENLTAITQRILRASAAPTAATGEQISSRHPPVRLVAVSKFHPASAIAALADSSAPQPLPQQHFGENYTQDLISKAQELHGRPGLADLKWHFIGGLQSNKCAKLVRETPGLWAVESVDTQKKASLLDKASAERLAAENADSSTTATNAAVARDDDDDDDADDNADRRLRVYVQVNTSDEQSKSGCSIDEALDLATFIEKECRALRLQGFMTIGSLDQSKATGEDGAENQDFLRLRQVRDRAAEALDLRQRKLELSMGMSEDFEGAIAAGSDQVRVGSKIFGARPLSNPAKT